MKIITVNQNDSGQRVDKFLAKFLPDMPKSLLYKQLRKKRIKRNKKALTAQDVLWCGDELYLYIYDEFFKEKAVPAASGAGLSMVYEDDNILIVDKPAGQSAHGGDTSLLAQIQGYLYEKGEYDPTREQSFSLALSNRLDRNTRGLVLAAKNARAQKILNEKIKEGQITKEYLCLVNGTPTPPKGRLSHWLFISPKENKVKVCKESAASAKQALLDYEVLETRGKESLLHITLLTGRKHQIRVQLSAVGHPLVGDTKYGAPKDSRFRYQALCAYRLTFNFTTDAGILAYLKGKSFAIKEEVVKKELFG